jgi:formyltetrahydrofolate deformylase
MSTQHSFILKLSCPDRPGIVHAVSGFLFDRGANILDSAQFGDSHTGEFFMRVHFQQVGGDPGLPALREAFSPLAGQFEMRWEIHDAALKPKVVIMVSKIGHCLNDLLFRYRTGQLSIEIPAIISNHKDFYQLAASYDIPFHHFPLTESTGAAKAAQEARVLEVIDQHGADLVVLARYMQILSPNLCEHLSGRAINIHHSFLPSFKGAKPYYQAFDRGVKHDARSTDGDRPRCRMRDARARREVARRASDRFERNEDGRFPLNEPPLEGRPAKSAAGR